MLGLIDEEENATFTVKRSGKLGVGLPFKCSIITL